MTTHAVSGPEAVGAQVMEHTAVIAAPPGAVYELVADVTRWPRIFGPTMHAEVVEARGDEEVIRLWATAAGRVRHWTSRRTLDAKTRTVIFRQSVPSPPVTSMGGEWRIHATEDGGSRVVLLHDFRARDDDPEALRLIERAVDRNSKAELAALRNAAELGVRGDELHFTFHDSETIHGSADRVYEFLDRAELWPERLDHVARTTLTEEDGVQHLDMDTRSPDGSTHNTVSVRVCFPERREIVYKQLRLPVALAVHTGRWEIEETGTGEVRATSWHAVTLDPEGVRGTLGEQATLADAREKVRHALGTNSARTLRHAKEFAERAVGAAGTPAGGEGGDG